MKLMRAACDDCGVFEMERPDFIQYVRWQNTPFAKVRCPECQQEGLSAVDITSAVLWEALGVTVHRPDSPITEAEVAVFVENLNNPWNNKPL